MQLTQISFTYQRTFNMGNYSNIKPTITLTADLNGDDPITALQKLTELAQVHIHNLIDTELERDDQPAYFYEGSRYKLLLNPYEKIAVIAPQDQDLPNEWVLATTLRYENWRLHKLKEKVANLPKYNTLLNCKDGDFSKLPPLTAVTIIRRDQYLILVSGALNRDDLPSAWNDWSTKLERQYRIIDSGATLVMELTTEAEQKGKTFLNLLHGSLADLPALPGWDDDGIPRDDDDESDYDD